MAALPDAKKESRFFFRWPDSTPASLEVYAKFKRLAEEQGVLSRSDDETRTLYLTGSIWIK